MLHAKNRRRAHGQCLARQVRHDSRQHLNLTTRVRKKYTGVREQTKRRQQTFGVKYVDVDVSRLEQNPERIEPFKTLAGSDV